MSALLDSSRDGHILHLALNRPAKRNALDSALCRDLVEALESADADPDIHTILLSAAGKSFCAGMDLAEAAAPPDASDIDTLHERLFTAGARLATPIVAAVHGAALAGGTGLVANCHVVVAAPDATFGLTEVRIGLWPFLVFRACAAAMGERRTLELSLTGRIFPAAEAREYGLVHEIAGDPLARAAEVARQIAAYSHVAIRKGLETVHRSRGRTAQQAGQIARAAREEVFQSPGFHQAIGSFLETRSPGPRPPPPDAGDRREPPS
ncbi:MAG TPA: enoyl-CoA hydratase/isomerase family protein [Verrucomicrobiae bacterium]|nr:enoyl-CoA hydratase/isomerase family protein [Verrucomicrobiae bacterium]